nr:immunoglobulin heavy chain junction region [Macaca mulatta]
CARDVYGSGIDYW